MRNLYQYAATRC